MVAAKWAYWRSAAGRAHFASLQPLFDKRRLPTRAATSQQWGQTSKMKTATSRDWIGVPVDKLEDYYKEGIG